MKLVLFIAACIGFYPVLSQEITVSISSPHKFTGQVNLVKTTDGSIAMDFDANSQLYEFNPYSSKHRISLLKYDTAFNIIKKTELANGKKVFGPFLPLIKRVYDQVRLFYFQRWEKEDKIDLVHSVIDTHSLELSPPQVILTIPQKKWGHLEVKDLVENWMLSMQQSPDLSKFLILWNSGKDKSFYYTVLDSSMQILRTKTETSADVKEFKVNNAVIDNAGNVYAAYGHDRVYVDKNGNAKTYTVEDGKDLTELYVSPAPDANILHLAGVSLDEDEDLIAAYSQDLDIRNGTFSQFMRTDFPHEMGERIINEVMIHYKGRNPARKRMFPHYHFTPIIRANGRIDLWGKTDVHFHTFTGPNNSYTLDAYASYVYIRNDQKQTRFIRIPKTVSGWETYFHYSYNNKIYLFYNDNLKNLDEDVTDTQFKLSKDRIQGLFVAVISEDGTVRRQKFDVGFLDLKEFLPLTPSTLIAPKLTDFNVTGNNYITPSKKNELMWVALQLQ